MSQKKNPLESSANANSKSYGHLVRRYIKRLGITVASVILLYLCVLVFPQPLFTHHMIYQNYEIWSDQPIAPHITQVLDDVTRRLRTSELYESDSPLRIFFCNASWRLWLYGHFSNKMAGIADTCLVRNIYIRASDIASNRVHPPTSEPLADADQRPLSYFIAHEATHIIESRHFGRLAIFRYPLWLSEGYADYVGKGGDFDFDENQQLLVTGSPLMDYQKSGLYRRFHLEVFFLIHKKGLTVKQIYVNPPNEEDLIREIKNYSPTLAFP
jgi:hypothetical protein